MVIGSELFRGEEEREMGFRAQLRGRAEDLRVLDISGGYGVYERTFERVTQALLQHPGLKAVYSVGGNRAIVDAFAAQDRPLEVFIGHDLDEENRQLLREEKSRRSSITTCRSMPATYSCMICSTTGPVVLPSRAVEQRSSRSTRRPGRTTASGHQSRSSTMLRIAVLGAGRIAKIHAANVAAHPNATLVLVADSWRAGVDALKDPVGMRGRVRLRRRAEPRGHRCGGDRHAHRHPHRPVAGCGGPGQGGASRKAYRPGYRQGAARRKPWSARAASVLGFNRRFDPDMLRLRQALDAGQIGAVRQVIITSRDPGLAPRDYLEHSGGILRDMTIHDF